MREMTPLNGRRIAEAWRRAAYPDFALKMDEVVSAWEADRQDKQFAVEALAICREQRNEAEDKASNLEARIEALEKAAALKRNVLIHDDSSFIGEWVAVPKEDFDDLRAALAAKPPSLPSSEES